jgi:hypothetical protein
MPPDISYTNTSLQILKKAVDIVGTANMDGQAMHKAAIDCEIHEGQPKRQDDYCKQDRWHSFRGIPISVGG